VAAADPARPSSPFAALLDGAGDSTPAAPDRRQPCATTRSAPRSARHIANRKLDVGTRTRRGRYTKVERAEGMSRDRESHRIALMERNARFYVEQATLAGRSATAILQGDPPPGCSRIGCKPIEVSMGPHGKRRRVWSPVAKHAS
jgi:hypothetical protein